MTGRVASSVQRKCNDRHLRKGLDMAINKRRDASGKVIGYTVVVAVPDPVSGKKSRRSIGTYLRRRDADDAERKAKIDIRNGVFQLEAPAPAMTVEDAIGAWFAAKRQTITSNSAAGYEAAIRLHLVPAFGDTPVTDLSHADIQSAVDRWQQAGMGSTLINRCLLILRGAMARQVRAGMIASNPVADIEKPGKRRKPFAVWSDQDLARFLEVAERDRWAPVWYLAAVEGLRRGEILGLAWSDIDWSDGSTEAVAHVRRTLVPDLSAGGKALLQDRAKTRSGERAIALTRPTVAVLRSHRDRQRFDREKAGDHWAAGDLICTTSVGTAINPSSIKRNLADLIERAGVPPLTTHGLRHQAITTMIRNGVSPVVVAAKVGHRSASLTTDVYSHLVLSDQSAANGAIEAALQRARGTA